MKNPFKRTKKQQSESPASPLPAPAEDAAQEAAPAAEAPAPAPARDDGFDAWCRAKVRGGVERRERNDFFEAYSVYGADGDGRLTCRYYHRYPEHERDFGLSYTRALSFDDFNRRLLKELDHSGVSLNEYRDCIRRAEALTGPPEQAGQADSFTEEEAAALCAFCESADILREQRCLHSEGVVSCSCVSAVGDEELMLRFRRILRHDALDMSVAGVSRESVMGYDIDDLWIMGIHNRLRDCCSSVGITRLTSEWSAERPSVWLFRCEGFDGAGELLAAAGRAESFRRFGFWSLDFSVR